MQNISLNNSDSNQLVNGDSFNLILNSIEQVVIYFICCWLLEHNSKQCPYF